MKIVRKLLVGAILAGFVAGAQALPLTLTEPIVLSPNTAIGNGEVSISYNLVDFGYDSLLHSLDSALLSLVFTVTGNNANQIANANDSSITVSLPGQVDFSSSVASFNSGSTVAITSAALNFGAGFLEFSLTRGPNPGTVTLTQATLSVNASLLSMEPAPPTGVGPNAVPEPGTLALLGLGLLGGIFVRRRNA